MGSGLTKYILIVVRNFSIKGLEKRIRKDEAIATAITMLRESLKKKQKTNTHLAKPDPISTLSRRLLSCLRTNVPFS